MRFKMSDTCSSSDEELETTLCLALLHRRRQRRKMRVTRRYWVRPIFAQRAQRGAYRHLVQELRLTDRDYHFLYLRMSKESFDYLLSLVSPMLSRRNYYSRARAEISPAERLVVTLRYLATGNSQTSLAFDFRMGISTVCSIVKETSDAIWQALQPLFVQVPSNALEWKRVSDDFQRMWNFPNCVGAIDGKHIVIQAPARAGSGFYNYKGTHSIVLMAVCDAQYRFVLVDVGDSGRHSDGGVLANSDFGKALLDDDIPFPDDQALPGTTQPLLPHVIVGDEAFPLRKNLLRPYPGRNLPEDKAVYNYRLSRARRTIENAFGILAARWRIFRCPIIAAPDNVVIFTKATIALHNFLRVRESSSYCPPGFTDSEDADRNLLRGGWRDEAGNTGGMVTIGRASSNMHSSNAAANRDAFRQYFTSQEGAVSWQLPHVRRTH